MHLHYAGTAPNQEIMSVSSPMDLGWPYYLLQPLKQDGVDGVPLSTLGLKKLCALLFIPSWTPHAMKTNSRYGVGGREIRWNRGKMPLPKTSEALEAELPS